MKRSNLSRISLAALLIGLGTWSAGSSTLALAESTYKPWSGAVLFDGEPRAFVNRCPHAGTELDWQPGEFFEEAGLYLICSTHGAIFDPKSGHCIMGPCKGQHLIALQVEERGGNVYLIENGIHNG